MPSPGAAPIYYQHPKTGGLDEIVVRSFLRQLGAFTLLYRLLVIDFPFSPCPEVP